MNLRVSFCIVGWVSMFSNVGVTFFLRRVVSNWSLYGWRAVHFMITCSTVSSASRHRGQVVENVLLAV